jgi:hypothetical protein
VTFYEGMLVAYILLLFFVIGVAFDNRRRGRRNYWTQRSMMSIPALVFLIVIDLLRLHIL